MVEGRTEDLEPLDVPELRPVPDIPGVPDDVQYLGEKLDAVLRAVEALGSQRDEPAATIKIFTAGVPQQWSVRTRIKLIRLVMDASATLTLTIGTATYLLRVRVDCDNIYELPFILEPGQEMVFTGTANTTFRAYVVAYPEADPRF